MDTVLDMQKTLDDMKDNIRDARCPSVQNQLNNVSQSLIQLSSRIQ